MNIIYKNNKIMATKTNNQLLMRYKFQKLYYAIIINNCNKYSSILSKQRTDIIMTDNDYKILSYKRGMHENTVYENENATTTILLPLNTFPDLEENTFLKIE